MRDYIDYVVVRMSNNKKYLFNAPSWSGLKADDVVTVDTVNGVELGTVVAVTTEPNSRVEKDVKFLLDSFDATWPLKRVIAKRVDVEFKYEDYEEVENYEQAESQKTE